MLSSGWFTVVWILYADVSEHCVPPSEASLKVEDRVFRNFGILNIRRRGITQKKTYNIRNRAKIWNQEYIYIFLFYERELILFIILTDFNTNCGDTRTYWLVLDKNVIFLHVMFINHEISTPFSMQPHLTVIYFRCIWMLCFSVLRLSSCDFVGCDTVLPCSEISEIQKNVHSTSTG